jgi:hypothetical protein
MKQCLSCGSQLPEGARACPQCGTFVPDPGTDPDGFNLPTMSSTIVPPTEAAAPYTPSQQPPSTYGANTYGTPPTPIYDAYRLQPGAQSYSSAEYAPPPPSANAFSSQVVPPPAYGAPQAPLSPSGGQGKRIALIAGIVVLVLILVGEGIVWLTPSHPSPAPTPTATTTTPVAQPNQDPYGTLGGTLVTSDPMHDNSKGNKWDEATMNDPQGNGKSVCSFTGGTYHITRSTPGTIICDPEAANLTLSNVVFEATLTVIQGDQAGLEVRVNQAKGDAYVVALSTDGSYAIDTETNLTTQQNPLKTLRTGKNNIIKAGLNQPNVVAISASGNTITLYVNGEYVDSVQDTTYQNGQLGIYGYGSNTLDVAISNVRVWKL